MNYEIKKGVPLPPAKRARTGLSDALRAMEVGDCIEGFKRASHLAQLGKRHSIKLATRKQADGTVTV